MVTVGAAVAIVSIAIAAIWLFKDPAAPPAAVTVLRVVDGDTIDVNDAGSRVRVRVLGIDSPELARDGRPAECYAIEAKARAEELLGSAGVGLVADPTQPVRDRYGRRLAYVTFAGADLGKELLRGGFAREYHPSGQGSPQRTVAYQAAQAQARSERRGMWGRC